jgi:AraC-like DNA-binding protein
MAAQRMSYLDHSHGFSGYDMGKTRDDWLRGLEPRAAQRQLKLGHRSGWIRAEIKPHSPDEGSIVHGPDRPLAANIVLRGQGTFTDEHNNCWQLCPGACFFPIPGLDGRAEYSTQSALEFFLAFDRFTSRSLRDLGFVRTVPYALAPTDTALRESILEVFGWLSLDNSSLSDRELLLRLVGFIEELQKHGEELSQPDSLEGRIGAACLLLEDPVDRNMPVSEIAWRVGMSYRTFRKSFAELKGCTPVAYRITRRMDRACRMLVSMPVKEVAAELGYCDPATFSHQFTKQFGVPPSRYGKS